MNLLLFHTHFVDISCEYKRGLCPASGELTAAMSSLLVLLVAAAPLLAATDGANTTEYGCALRAADSSYVCVCNATYCDNIVRTAPADGEYVVYISSKSGLRFNKSTGDVEDSTLTTAQELLSSLEGHVVLEVDTNTTYQTVRGFGGAVTDSAAINWLNVSTTLQDLIIKNYYSSEGLEYNMLRVPIGGSDFSTRAYAYNEYPENDTALTNYTLTDDDTLYKIPMIKAILSEATEEVHIVSTVWSPPKWMKSNGAWSGSSRLLTDYYQTFADYHLKFLEKYAEHNISIWAITTTNEPLNGVIPLVSFNSLGWTPSTMGKWIIENLGPTLRNSSNTDISNVKILAVDDQRYTVPIWMYKMVKANSTVLDYISGVAVHYYGDDFVPASVLTWIHEQWPDVFLLATEACEGSKPWNLRKVILGSWNRAANYITDIIEDMNHWVSGWIDWNLVLNTEGGPNWAENYVDSPIIVMPEDGEFVKQPMFYAMGHFAKFVPRGSVRVDLTKHSIRSVDHIAFVTPRNTIVIVMYNSSLLKKEVQIVVDSSRLLTVNIPAHAIATVELNQ